MACFLGLTGHAHTHASRMALDLSLESPAAETVMVANTAEENCAVCLWKAQTPFVPPVHSPVELCCLAANRHVGLQPRAPPALTPNFYQNRAPPTHLS